MLQAALDEQKKKMEGDMARHLAFIDRLLADKDKLSAKCVHLGKETKVPSQNPSYVGPHICKALRHRQALQANLCVMRHDESLFLQLMLLLDE